MEKGKVSVLIDGQWGSTGKGKLAGILALKHEPNLAICNYMTNAGHTWVPDDEGRPPVMVQQLPSALIYKKAILHIAATAAIYPKVFDAEVLKFDPDYGVLGRLSVDPRAAIIRQDHKDTEAANLHRVSSTVKGCGAVSADKIMRRPVLVENDNSKGTPSYWHGAMIEETERVVQIAITNHWKILFETAQGFDLSLNHGTRYPFSTSRDITTCQALSDACVPPGAVGTVYGCLRAFPIRVGNAFEVTGGSVETKDGWSGPYYPDQKELSWDEITQLSGAPYSLLERTTVTNKVRRIFTFSKAQLERFIRHNAPSCLFINFVNYIDHVAYGKVVGPLEVRDFYSAFPKIKRFVEEVEELGVPVAYLGTGPKHSHVVDLGIDQ